MLGEPTPHEADPIGAQYAFEKRVTLDDLAADDPSDTLATLRASSCDH
jgi:hypothetical protein